MDIILGIVTIFVVLVVAYSFNNDKKRVEKAIERKVEKPSYEERQVINNVFYETKNKEEDNTTTFAQALKEATERQEREEKAKLEQKRKREYEVNRQLEANRRRESERQKNNIIVSNSSFDNSLNYSYGGSSSSYSDSCSSSSSSSSSSSDSSSSYSSCD